MKYAGMLPFRTALCGLALLAVSAKADSALYNEYCSSQNSGSGNGPYFNIYNSMGSCSDKCRAQFALAVVQGQNCWCSNYIPAKQGSTSECNSPCPGYPDNLCGNPDEGLYGYVPLDKAPSGTAGASGSQQTTSPSADKTPAAQVSPTVTKTVTEEQSRSPSVVVSFVTPGDSSSSYAPSSSSSSKDTTTTKSIVMTQVTTISGNAVTQTVTTTPVGMAPNTASSDDPPALEKTGLSGGAIAGVVIGTLLGVAVIALAAFLLWRRRRSSDTEGGTSGSPKRKGSVLSRAGLLGAARPQSMAENNYDDPYSADPVTRTNSIRHSMLFGGASTAEGIAPAGPLGSSSDNGSEKRQSKPLVYDQRLNPSALWVHHDNGSRVSMQDQQDYSRPLGLANPDFARTYSFDSR